MNHTPSRLRDEMIREFNTFNDKYDECSRFGFFEAGVLWAFEKAAEEADDMCVCASINPDDDRDCNPCQIANKLRQLGESLK